MSSSSSQCMECGVDRSGSYTCNRLACPHPDRHPSWWLRGKRIDNEDLDAPKPKDMYEFSEEKAEQEARENKTARYVDHKRSYDIRALTKDLVIAGLPFLNEEGGSNGYVVGYGDAMAGYVRAMHKLAVATVDITEND